ncbi:hypothetical protein MUK42_30399 [Musa troglodytarum]|uniref:non-specific serine/threonine protein kinase n=1 Tax=Musa troglodytarum TaxID=320322 RepID=A0A9E7FGB0_9LILI|nr:hypothetical protein MUK42_30399 [Musa troglodytarum]
MHQEEGLSFCPPDSSSDLDSSFTSSTTSASTISARSSLSLPSFSASSSFAIKPLPRNSSDPYWSALRAVGNLSPDGLLHLHHFRLIRPLGSGHLARVFHCRLNGFDDDHSPVEFALKDCGNGGGKTWHVSAEAGALAEMDHPFLPTLYARLDASHYACFLIDYCPGGDLQSLLSRRRGNRLPPAAARFYAAEVLLALEYLHALGFVYRDLKPENILLRADGHVMLSDFDLSFRSHVSPALLRQGEELEFVAEPSSAFSRACVGTHEYLAPEVVSGRGHGSAVDWWAFGVFLFELLYGRTPFKGATKEATLRNILTREVRFPESNNGGDEAEMAKAKDLITRLLVRDPAARMGSAAGAAEIKRHPFFEGLWWPLIRCVQPPVVPGPAGGPRVQTASEGSGRRLSGWRKSTNNDKISNREKRGTKPGLGFGFRVRSHQKGTKEKSGGA